MTTGYASLAERKNELIRKGLAGSVFVAPSSAPAVTASTLFDAETGDLTALPTGYQDLGWLDTSGAKFSRAVKTADISSWGSNEPTRSDVTSDVTSLVINPQETNQATIALYLGVADSAIAPGANGVVDIQRPSISTPRYFRVLVVSVDETSAGEIAICRFMPRALVTAYADQSLANGDDPILWGVTLQAYEDSALGFDVEDMFGGAGWQALLADEDIPRIVTCTTATTTALVATAGTFEPDDVGAEVSAAGKITPGTTIEAFVDSTHVTMSAVGLAAGTGIAVTVG